eukprot:CAMPEP_0119546296 /NCGR_PEP_ID=MMETSP1352-20130426/781_1 /TAXON_ID=265584 /ORGANISM="Stauroneis constricta, Strain CCMP1120" /LENGTH=321 /DNA_ID=CAMNT_0007590985 /DNA_START=107 /DNA_END=1072 /DNA_ORIENTATION=+
MTMQQQQDEQTTATLLAMRKQEDTAYACRDYLNGGDDNDDAMMHDDDEQDAPADVECRFRMIEWCYQIVDFCRFERATVAVAISYLDRFLASAAGRAVLKDRTQFQLAAMTCLYTAVKIHEPEAMEPKLIASLSRGAFTPQQVERMEVMILNAIQWRVNPPTAVAFCQLLLDHLSLGAHEQTAIMDLAKFQTELAVSDYAFVSVAQSSIGFAAFMNALESLQIIDPVRLMEFQFQMSQTLQLSTEITQIQIRLFEAVTKQPGSEQLFRSVAATQQSHAAMSSCNAVPSQQQQQQLQSQQYADKTVAHYESPRSVVSPTNAQ